MPDIRTLKGRLRALPGLRALRLARLRRIARTSGHADWRALLSDEDASAWARARETAAGPRVLIATGIGGHLALAALDSTLGVALTLRGARARFLLCDEVLPACQMAEAGWYPDTGRFARQGPADLCGHCHRPADKGFASAGLPVETYGRHLTDAHRAEARRLATDTAADAIPTLTLDGAPIGEVALSGALRFFARGDLSGEPHGDAILRRYLEAAVLTYRAVEAAVRAEAIDIVVTHHGIYVPQGAARLGALAAGARVVTWNPAYRRHCFLFSHHDTYHHTLMDEPTAAWDALDLNDGREGEILDYLKSRWTGSNDWIWFHESPQFDTRRIVRDLGLDPDRPIIGLLTNVVWDAQLHYPANAYGSMLEWVEDTIRYFAGRPDLQLAIRIHPAEIRGTPPSRQRMADEIARRFPTLPDTVFVIGPDSDVSTYALLELCDTALIYGTKMGVELTAMGIPAIVAGEAWIRNKGLAEEADSPDHHRALLDTLPRRARLDEATVRRARRYAYHFFFRRMIPLPFMEATGGWPPYTPRPGSLDALRPGASAGLDVICDGILTGSPFIYPAENGA